MIPPDTLLNRWWIVSQELHNRPNAFKIQYPDYDLVDRYDFTIEGDGPYLIGSWLKGDFDYVHIQVTEPDNNDALSDLLATSLIHALEHNISHSVACIQSMYMLLNMSYLEDDEKTIASNNYHSATLVPISLR